MIAGRWKNDPQPAFVAVALLLICARFLHFGPYLDDPHLWRQADTAQYIWSFFHEGFDLLHPSVAWMGGHKTVILEFPLPEAIVALFQKVLGEGLWVGRLIFLLSFALSAYFLFKIIQKLATEPIAQLATLIYLAMPLGLFYSRAIHIDGFATMLVHGTLWASILAIEGRNARKLAWASAIGTLAILTKAPYLLVIVFPLALFIHQTKSWKWLIRRIYWAIPPLLFFLIWEYHRAKVNGSAPDWYFIPNYRKFVNMAGWYFGDMYQRKELANYFIITGRIITEILVSVGLIPLAIGLIGGGREKGSRLFYCWAAATVLYVLVFFNLNRIHNYYQIPFMAPLAWGMAYGLQILAKRIPQISERLTISIALAVFFLFSFRFAERNYYADAQFLRVTGERIQAAIPQGDHIITTYGGLDPRAPHILYHAHRYGWSIPETSISPEIIQKLKENGAQWWAYIGTPDQREAYRTLPYQEKASISLPHSGKRLFIFHL